MENSDPEIDTQGELNAKTKASIGVIYLQAKES